MLAAAHALQRVGPSGPGWHLLLDFRHLSQARWLLLDCCVAALLDGPSSNSSSDLSDSSGADMGDMM